MSFAKLTTREIEQKIDYLIDRTNALADIICEVKEPSGKATLQLHQNEYLKALADLRSELGSRNRSCEKPSSAN